MRAAAAACRDRWLREGVDLAAYNTVENAADVNDLRLALGYDKMTLVGGSYGSHLALQLMRQFPRIRRPGRDVRRRRTGSHVGQSVRHVATLGASRRRPSSQPPSPDAFRRRIPEALERVIARLESSPQTVTVGNGANARTVVVDADLVRLQARRDAGRRTQPHLWPEMILAIDRGDYSLVARAASSGASPAAPPMHYSIDCAVRHQRRAPQALRERIPRARCSATSTSNTKRCAISGRPRISAHRFAARRLRHPHRHLARDMGHVDADRECARSRRALRNGQLIEVVGGNHGALYNLFGAGRRCYPLLRRVSDRPCRRLPRIRWRHERHRVRASGGALRTCRIPHGTFDRIRRHPRSRRSSFR